MRLLVTGAAGFTGIFLAEYLSHETGVQVTGLIRKSSQKDLLPHTTCILADLLDREHLIDAVNDICPDAIIHIGGMTRGDLGDLLKANVIGTKNILDPVMQPTRIAGYLLSVRQRSTDIPEKHRYPNQPLCNRSVNTGSARWGRKRLP